MPGTDDIRDGAKIIDAQRARDMVMICDVAEAAIRLVQQTRILGVNPGPAIRSLENSVNGLPDRLIRELLGQ